MGNKNKNNILLITKVRYYWTNIRQFHALIMLSLFDGVFLDFKYKYFYLKKKY